MRVVLEIQRWRFQIAITDGLNLLFEQRAVFLRGVEPILAPMGLKCGFRQVAIDLADRD